MPSFLCMPFFACNRQVDSLDKRQCNLQTIPSEIERYGRTLEELLLDMNHIKDLPKSLFRLHKLRRLGLSDNDIHRLPPEISHLQNLVELNISRNDISDLPEDLKVCRQLLVLDVSSNPIARLPDYITHVLSLSQLSLNDTSLTKLPQDIGRLASLKSLEVRENHLRSLPPSIVQLTQLLRLDLGQNELDELPAEIGSLKFLQELYVDDNSLESLPESILCCVNLEQLDVQSNRLMALPLEIGDLCNLADLTLSHNCLSTLPNSIGRLKKLLMLRLDDNSLTQLTPAIGSCASLTELYLMQNLISELPSSIGNLSRLQNLNVDKNQITHVPALIGDCSSLTLLSFRDNLIEELPLEIGKLNKLRVLDVCNNRLSHLPFTVNVLFNLQALWLSENQSQALLKLQQEVDARTGIKVLTCYLLPQQSAGLNAVSQKLPNRSFVGGPKVHFGDMSPEFEAESIALSLNNNAAGHFERHDTPHPKPNTGAPKLSKKQVIDGHIIPRLDEHPQPTNLTLHKKTSVDQSDQQRTLSTRPGAKDQPRSALKHSSAHLYEQGVVESGSKQPAINAENSASSSQLNLLPSSSVLATSPLETTKQVVIRREPNHGLGLSIAGGAESTPYKEGDSGLFISKLISNAPAERAGLQVGDKVLEINGVSMANKRHDAAVQCIKEKPNIVSLLISRETTPSPAVSASPVQPPASLSASSNALNESQGGRNVISTSVRLKETGSPGFTIEQQGERGSTPHLLISSIKPWEREGKILTGDHLLSINGINVSSMGLEEVMPLLKGEPASELYLVVARPDKLTSSKSPSIHSLHSITPMTKAAGKVTVADLPFGDTSFDGVVEDLQLIRDSNNTLGLSIVGGIDHCSHPFGTDNPGVFISKIASSSPASASRQLRVGDRILKVNGKDVDRARHDEAVEALKNSGHSLNISVKHEPQPKGLQEVVFRRRKGEPLGLSICGGVNSPPANLADPTDEGIFIEHVELGGCAQQCPQIQVGQRILEVNDDSLLGCTKEEAAQLLRRAPDTVRLLICDGCSKDGVNGVSSYTAGAMPCFENGKPLATSSPIPPALPPKRSAESIIRQREGDSNNLKPSTNEVTTRFSTTLPISSNSAGKLAPPTAPKPAISQPANSLDSHNSTSFSTCKPGSTNQSSSSLTTSAELPSSYIIHPTAKKPAENHGNSTTFTTTTQVHPITVANNSSSSSLSQRDMELQKKREWRNARMASLDAESAKADELMNCVREISRLGNVMEERSLGSPTGQEETLNGKKSGTRIIPIKLPGGGTVGAVGADIRFADEDK